MVLTCALWRSESALSLFSLLPSPPLQDQDISCLEEAIRNRLASRTGTSGRSERLGAKRSLFSNDEWARIATYMAFMEREDERRAAAAARAQKRETRTLLAGQVAQAKQRK
jgi:hypothetical protein